MYSVIIPYYDHKEYLPALFESLECQKGFIGEVIIVDDGTPNDGLECFLESYISDLKSKIRLFKQNNCGTSAALNFGIAMAKCEKIAILNSDDYFAHDKLSRCNTIFYEYAVDFIFGAVNFVDRFGQDINGRMDTSWYKVGLNSICNYNYFPALLFQENIAVTSSNFVFTRELYYRIGPFRSFRYANDLDFLMRAVVNFRFHFDKDVIHTNYRYHNNNTIKENIYLTTEEVRQIALSMEDKFHTMGDEAHNELKIACKVRGFSL